MGADFVTKLFAGIQTSFTETLTALGTAIMPIITAILGVLVVFVGFRYSGAIVSGVKRLFKKL